MIKNEGQSFSHCYCRLLNSAAEDSLGAHHLLTERLNSVCLQYINIFKRKSLKTKSPHLFLLSTHYTWHNITNLCVQVVGCSVSLILTAQPIIGAGIFHLNFVLKAFMQPCLYPCPTVYVHTSNKMINGSSLAICSVSAHLGMKHLL